MNEEELKKLQYFSNEVLKVKFIDLALLKNALTHRSYINENNGIKSNNERLEFLGDAVLELVITEYLFHKYPNYKEGELTSFRSATVKTTSLAETALIMNMGDYLYMSRGEEKTGGRIRPYILANTFEAIIGAIFLDCGLEEAKKFIKNTLISKIEIIIKNRLDIDSKSRLQELSQEKFNITPSYHLISEDGPDHNKIFKMGVKIGGKVIGIGEGHNKQEAESNAAKEAINNWEEINL